MNMMRRSAMIPHFLLGALLVLAVLAYEGYSSPEQLLAAEEAEVESLLKVLERGGVVARREALPGLAKVGDPSSVPPIAKALRDEDPMVRELAAAALWSIWMRSGDAKVDALLNDGTRKMADGQLDQALEAFDIVIAKAPHFAEGYNKRATALYHQGKYRQSLRDIDETLKRNPYHFGALSGAGLCMIGLKRWEEALVYFERALRINPNLPGILELKEGLAARLKKPMT